MPWEEDISPEVPEPTPPPTGGHWATPEEEKLPPGAAPIQQVKKPEPEMPSVGSALMQGVGAGFRHAGEGIQTLRGQKVEESAAPPSPAAAPFEWSDITSPVSKGLPKLAYGLGESSPTLAGGLGGGALGAMTPMPGGAFIGGGLGAAAGTALQTISPYFQEELKKAPQDPDGAWTKALERAGAAGAFSGAGWAAFPLKVLGGPLKNLAFQAFGVQPGISMAGQAAQNVLQDKPIEEGLGGAYAHGAVGTAVPMLGHHALGRAFGEAENVLARRANDPILSQLGHPDDLRTATSLASVNQKLSDVYQSVKDDLNPIRIAEKHMMDGTPLPPEMSAYIAARLTRGSAGKAEHFIDRATFDAKTGQNNGPALKESLEPSGKDLDPFRKYLLARKAIEEEGRGKNILKDPSGLAEAHAYVKANPQFAPQMNNWLKYQDKLLQYLVDGGLVGLKDAARMRAAIRNYVPLYRLMESPEVGAGAGTNPGAGMKTYNPIRGLGESQLQFLDPIETTIRNTYLFLSLADRNMALQKLEDINFLARPENKLMTRVKPEVRPVNVSAEEVERALRRQGVTTSADPESFNIFRPDAFRPDPNHIRLYRDGKAVTYQVDQRLGEAINGLNREQLGLLTRMLAIPAKTLRAGATLSPEFIARNPIRDQFSAFIFSMGGRGYVPLYDLAKGAFGVGLKREGYWEWLKSGGANSALVSIDRNYIENLVRKMSDPSLGGTLKNVARSPLEPLRAMSELMENATRVGEFMRQRGRGASLAEAGYASREVTLDFQRIGAKMQGLNAIIAFFNAQAEGVDRMFRSMKEQPLGFTAKVGASITLPSVYLWWANKDDPRMKEIPRWQKDIFWIVPTDNWQPISAADAQRAPTGFTRKKNDGTWEINKGNIWRIPKPFELGVLFGSVPERILDAYYAKDPKAFKNVGKSLVSAFLPNFVPQAVSPLIEQYANHSLFTDRPLIPRYLEGVLPQEQANPYTSDTAKIAGKVIANIPGVSSYFGLDKSGSAAAPIMVENYIRAWTGGLGTHALSLSDAALRGAGITPTPILPTLTNADKTGIKAFAVRFPEAGANSIQDFYEEFNKRQSVKKTADYLRKSGESGRAQDLMRDNVMATGDKLQKAIGAQMKMVRNAYQDKTKMTPDEKRQYIDMAYLQMIKMAQIGNKMFQETEEAFKKRKAGEP